MNVHDTTFFDHTGRTKSDRVERRVTRDYAFSEGDERRSDRKEAHELAIERAKVTGKIQQARLVDGPLLGQRIWLIQTTTTACEGTARVRTGERVRIGDRVQSWPHLHDVYGTVVEITPYDNIAVVTWDNGETHESPSIRKAPADAPPAPRFETGDLILTSEGYLRQRRADGFWVVLAARGNYAPKGSTLCNPGSVYAGLEFDDNIAACSVDGFGNQLIKPAV